MNRIQEIFNLHEGEYLEFNRVRCKRSRRPDVHAFMLLDGILTPVDGRAIICHSTHDEICLDVDLEELAKYATEEQLIELHRCGVRYSTDHDCLAMFV